MNVNGIFAAAHTPLHLPEAAQVKAAKWNAFMDFAGLSETPGADCDLSAHGLAAQYAQAREHLVEMGRKASPPNTPEPMSFIAFRSNRPRRSGPPCGISAA